MSRIRLNHLVVACAALLFCFFREGVPAGEEIKTLLDEARFAYSEPHDQRTNGDVHVRLVGDYAGARVEIAVSAEGPAVRPAPGFEWKHGANVITAIEMESLAAEGRLRGTVTHSASGREREASYRAGCRRRLSIRSVSSDGRIDFQAYTPIDYLLSLDLSAALFGEGLHRIEWQEDGEARLVVIVEWSGRTGRILDIE